MWYAKSMYSKSMHPKENNVILVIKAHIFWEGHKIFQISTLYLSVCTVDKSKVEISQNFVAFSEYTNFDNEFGQ